MPKGLESDPTGFPGPMGLNLAAVCFEANWEYANYLVPVLLGPAEQGFCNNLRDLLGLIGCA